MILYLDFDGVLHAYCAYRTQRGIMLKGGGALFQHTCSLVTALEPHYDIQIVLSTSWVRELGFDRAKKYLPSSLQQRVIGATYHSSYDSRNSPWVMEVARTPWASLTRYQQIARHEARHKITDWLAIDNDDEGWPADQNHRLVLTDDDRGLDEAAAAAQKEALKTGS